MDSGVLQPAESDSMDSVELLYQPIAEQTRDKQGVWHTSPTDVEVSGNTFVSAILLLKKIRGGVGAKHDETTLTYDQFDAALENLKTVFQHNFLLNKKLAHDLRQKSADSDAFIRKEKKQINNDFRGAFFV